LAARIHAGVVAEVGRCGVELDRLRTDAGRRTSLAGAVAGSLFAVTWGNGLVVAGRRLGHDQVITLLGVPALGVAGVLWLHRRKWPTRAFGLHWPEADPPRRLGFALVGVAAAALVFGTAGLALGDAGLRLRLARLVIGTAAGEELLHRGVLLALWSSTPLRGPWVLAANMVAFGAWHAAGAVHPDGFKPAEVIGPALATVPLLWARLRFRSLLIPTLFHAASNMPGLVTAHL
jgi:membrane protease YdiL (CAAX protease family)